MFLLSILPGHPWLVWGCRETGRRCSRWLLTGPPKAHLGREDIRRLDLLMEIHLLDGLFSFTSGCQSIISDKYIQVSRCVNITGCVLITAKTASICIHHSFSDFIPSVCPCLPSVLMTLATVKTDGTRLSLIPS